MDNNLNQQELITKCFGYWNSLKRNRGLAEVRRQEGRREDMNYHLLQEYKMSELLELSLRALQKGQRQLDATTEEESDDTV